MKKINRRRFIMCSAALLSTSMPAYALWPFSDEKNESAGSADITGKIFGVGFNFGHAVIPAGC